MKRIKNPPRIAAPLRILRQDIIGKPSNLQALTSNKPSIIAVMGLTMTSIHEYREQHTVDTLLNRITGKPRKVSGRAHQLQYTESVPEPNRKLLLGFYRSLVTEDLSVGRRSVLLGNMYRVCIWIKHRPFSKMTRSDVIDLVELIKNRRVTRNVKRLPKRPYAPQTIESYKISIKKFWRWLKNPGLTPDILKEIPYPPEVSWIRRKKGKNALLPKDIWSPDEVNKMAALASSERDRAFILCLFGSGCRIGEFLPLKRSDIEFDRYSAQILVNGKTGPRRVRLTPAGSVALAAWLDVHPNKARDAPVWINIQIRRNIPKRHLSYDWARSMLIDIAKRTEIAKHPNPHRMRHSLATFYAPRLTEAVMNEHFGWRQGGRTAAIYTHLSGKQVDDQILSVFGKKNIDPQSNKAVDVTKCHRCGLTNTPTSIQCGKCGFPMSEEASLELHTRRERADKVMDALISNPEFMELMKKFLSKK